MLKVSGQKGEMQSNMDNCEAAVNDCDELKMFQLFKNEGENQSHSLVFKITKISQTSSKSTFAPSNKNKILSSDQKLSSFEKFERNPVENANSLVQIAQSPAVKTEETKVNEPRRSLRLLELQSKQYSSRESEKKNLQAFDTSATKRKYSRKVKSVKGSVENSPNIKKQATKRKSPMHCPSSQKKIVTEISETPSKRVLNPARRMKLKSMMLFPTPKDSLAALTTRIHGRIYPKFDNADPSRVLSGLIQQENITNSLTSGNIVSLLFPGRSYSQIRKPKRNYASSNEEYQFKKANLCRLHLSKKYPLLDLYTLDKCYGMSNGSWRKTEIMLLDIIAGKEVFSTNILDTCSDSISKYDNENVYTDCHCLFPSLYWPSIGKKQFNKQSCNNDDSLCREIIVQSLKILYSEEAIL